MGVLYPMHIKLKGRMDDIQQNPTVKRIKSIFDQLRNGILFHPRELSIFQ